MSKSFKFKSESVLDKIDLTNIYRYNRSTKTLFSAFLFFLVFEGTLRPQRIEFRLLIIVKLLNIE